MGCLIMKRIGGVLTLAFLSPRLRLPCFGLIGVVAGLGLATAQISRVGSYMSDQPEACVNCHVMRPVYASWQHSSHASAATCNDCHVPHDTKINALMFKARDGLYHSYIFTLRLEPQVIEISSGAKPVVQANCIRCHEATMSEVCLGREMESGPLCWDCHRQVPHGDVHGLSATPRPMSPELPSVLERKNLDIGGRAPRKE